MADCQIKSFNAVRAKIFGYKITLIQWFILRRSSPYPHDEFRFSERYDNISFSATLMEGSKGARFRYIKYSHPERWDKVIVPMTDEQEDRAYREAKRLEGTLYDLVGQLSHLTPLKIWRPSKKKTWCAKTVGRLVYAARWDFRNWLADLLDITELRPDQLDFMARFFFGEKDNVAKELKALMEEYLEINNVPLLLSELRKLNETN